VRRTREIRVSGADALAVDIGYHGRVGSWRVESRGRYPVLGVGRQRAPSTRSGCRTALAKSRRQCRFTGIAIPDSLGVWDPG
jgi:hypothetical protein